MSPDFRTWLSGMHSDSSRRVASLDSTETGAMSREPRPPQRSAPVPVYAFPHNTRDRSHRSKYRSGVPRALRSSYSELPPSLNPLSRQMSHSARLIVLHGLHELSLGIHDERPVPRDRFLDRFTRHDQNRGVFRCRDG